MKYPGLTLIALLLSLMAKATTAPITGDTALCAGAHVTLSDISAGGLWSVSNTAVATISPAGRLTGVAAGTATVTYAIDTSYATLTITVFPLPEPFLVTGGGSHCAGSPGVSISLSGSEAGIVYYIEEYDSTGWKAYGGYGGTGSPIGLGSYTLPGTYYVYGLDYSTGCVNDMYGRPTVAISPSPSLLSGPSTVCEGSVITLSDSVAGGTWSSSASALVSVDTNGNVTGLSTWAAEISYTLPNGCYRTKLISEIAMPAPTVSYDPMTTAFYVTPAYDNYQWYDSTLGLIPDATAPTLAATKTQYYYVEVSDNNGCSRTSPQIEFNVDELHTAIVRNNGGWSVYPNPATSELVVSSAGNANPTTYRILDMTGRLVMKGTIVNLTQTLDVSGLAPGDYVFGLYSAGGNEGSLIFVKK